MSIFLEFQKNRKIIFNDLIGYIQFLDLIENFNIVL
jgi:hypothetical protein